LAATSSIATGRLHEALIGGERAFFGTFIASQLVGRNPRKRSMSDQAAVPAVTNPVAPRPAATLLIVREGAVGHEVLMGRRSAGHRFMPNSLVFPGGAVDATDYHAPLAAPLPPHVVRLVARQVNATFAHALGAALARELEEETALTLGQPPALDGVDYLCRAITPSIRPKRFDAWFFVVSADCVGGTIHPSDELAEVSYRPLTELLTAELEFATRASLDWLQVWLAMSETERLGRVTIPVMREKVWQDE
jgi:8-oxo-dGTP pyrophosphatase MutT (NUDIX family)